MYETLLVLYVFVIYFLFFTLYGKKPLSLHSPDCFSRKISIAFCVFFISLLLHLLDHKILINYIGKLIAVDFCTFRAYEMVMELFLNKEVDRVSHKYNVDHNQHQCLLDCLSFQLIQLQQLILYCNENINNKRFQVNLYK